MSPAIRIVSMASDDPFPSAPAKKSNIFEYIEGNPVAAIFQALAIGFAIGIIVRLIEGSGDKKADEIDVSRKPSLDEDKSSTLAPSSSPSSGPAWQKAYRRVQPKSAEEVYANQLRKAEEERPHRRRPQAFEKS